MASFNRGLATGCREVALIVCGQECPRSCNFCPYLLILRDSAAPREVFDFVPTA